MAFYKTLDASTEFSTKLIQELISEHKEHIEAYKELKDFYTGISQSPSQDGGWNQSQTVHRRRH